MKKRFLNSGIPALFVLILAIHSSAITLAQQAESPFYFGVDLSYVNEVEDCGAVYRENGEPRDPFVLFADHGATLVRARLWHNPEWTNYSTLEDVKRTFARAQDAGMSTLLDIHYSDNWADPGRQEIPAAWLTLDDDALVEAVYQYTTDVLTELAGENLVPAFIQIGNETNSGILKGEREQNWARDARLFNAGIRAVRDFSAAANQHISILLHVAQPENTMWWFTQAEAAGITDFDVIGISYYPQWSAYSISDMGAHVTLLRQRFSKDVMVLETGYGWTREAVNESAGNVLNEGLRGYSFSPDGQYRFMRDLTQSLISNGAIGVVYWEPAWVSTACLTRWGQGSHWENATFFNFQNNNELLESIAYLSDEYVRPALLADGVIEPEYGEPFVVDNFDDVPNDVAALDLSALHVRAADDTLFIAITVVGNVFNREGSYLLYVDTTYDAQGATVDVGRRPLIVADPFKPEFRLDVSILSEGGTSRASYTLNAWIENEWETISLTGGVAIATGVESTIEVLIPAELFGNPSGVNLAVVSADRGRARGASDIMGTGVIEVDSDDEVLVVDQFFAFMMP